MIRMLTNDVIDIVNRVEEINQEKEQFNKYKEISVKKIELDNKNLEQKCLKFKEIVNQFNSNFKPVLDEE